MRLGREGKIKHETFTNVLTTYKSNLIQRATPLHTHTHTHTHTRTLFDTKDYDPQRSERDEQKASPS